MNVEICAERESVLGKRSSASFESETNSNAKKQKVSKNSEAENMMLMDLLDIMHFVGKNDHPTFKHDCVRQYMTRKRYVHSPF